MSRARELGAARQRLKAKFAELDANGNGTLEYSELLALLRQGNPGITDREAVVLWGECDKNNDGTVSFNEFVDFVHDMHLGRLHGRISPPHVPGPRQRSGGREMRHMHSRQPSKSGSDDARERMPALRRNGSSVSVRSGASVAEHRCDSPQQPSSSRRHRSAPLSPGPSARRPIGGFEGDEDYWEQIKPLFFDFCTMEGEMDGREFAKWCQDCGLYDKRFAVHDVDLIFAKCVAPGSRRIAWLEFQEALRNVARRKGCSTIEVQGQIIEAVGSRLDQDDRHARPVRRNVHVTSSREDEDDRHARLARRTANVASSRQDEDAASWPAVEAKFDSFCDTRGLSVTDFVKLLTDCGVISKERGSLTRPDAELIFSNARVAGRQKFIWFDQFKEALRLVAAKKGCTVSEVQADVGCTAGGPQYEGTHADRVRFHDDRSTYTGIHARR